MPGVKRESNTRLLTRRRKRTTAHRTKTTEGEEGETCFAAVHNNEANFALPSKAEKAGVGEEEEEEGLYCCCCCCCCCFWRWRKKGKEGGGERGEGSSQHHTKQRAPSPPGVQVSQNFFSLLPSSFSSSHGDNEGRSKKKKDRLPLCESFFSLVGGLIRLSDNYIYVFHKVEKTCKRWENRLNFRDVFPTFFSLFFIFLEKRRSSIWKRTRNKFSVLRRKKPALEGIFFLLPFFFLGAHSPLLFSPFSLVKTAEQEGGGWKLSRMVGCSFLSSPPLPSPAAA